MSRSSQEPHTPRSPSLSGHAMKGKTKLSEKVVVTDASSPEVSVYAHFVEWCESKYGSLVVAWHKMDKDGSMSLTRNEFIIGLRGLDYHGRPEELWTSIDTDRTGTVHFTEFAPRSARLLAGFKHWADGKFGTAHALFDILDRNGNKTLSFDEFTKGCHKLGLPQKLKECIQTLFWLMHLSGDPSGGHVVSEREFHLLDAWKCPPYLWEDPDHKSRYQFQAAALEQFKSNAIIAWRELLDHESTMRVSYDEFVLSCKKLYSLRAQEVPSKLDIIRMYLSFDPGRTGFFGLKSWDKDAYCVLSAFTTWAKRKHGNPSSFIRNKESHAGAGIHESAFYNLTEELHLNEVSVQMLFDGLTHGSERVHVHDVAFLDHWDFDMGGKPVDSKILLADSVGILALDNKDDLPTLRSRQGARTSTNFCGRDVLAAS